MMHAVSLAAAVAVLASAFWSGSSTPEPPENVDGLAVED